MKVCAIIPAFDEARHIAAVIEKIKRLGLDVLVVDDCSRDNTSDVARAAGAEVLCHDMNRGKGGALATGIDWAIEHGYEAVLTLDGDGQHDADEIPKLLKAAEGGADVVVGSRMAAAASMPPIRKLTNWFMSEVVSFMAGRRISDSQSGFRLIRTATWSAVGVSTTRFDTESEFLVRACRMGYSYAEAPIRTIYGDETSSIRPFRDSMRWLLLVSRLMRSSHSPARRDVR